MRVFVHLGFGKLVPIDWAERAKQVSHGARFVIPAGANASEISRLVGNVQENGFREGVFGVAPWESIERPSGKLVSHRESDWRPSPEATAQEARQLEFELRTRGIEDGFYVEVCPEVDLDPVYKKDLGLVIDTVTAVREAIRLPVVAPAVSNLAKRGRRYLERMVPKLPAEVMMNFHPYRTTSEPDEFEGFDSLREVGEYILGLAGGRGFGITEVGWHNAEQTVSYGLFKCKKRVSYYDEETTRGFAARDIKFWRALGTRFYTWFQIRDGLPEDPDFEAHFGAYRADGSEKPVANALKEAL